MKQILKGKLLLKFHTGNFIGIFLSLFLIVILSLSSCVKSSESPAGLFATDESKQNEISIQSFELIDLNGGDIYPDEKLSAVLKIANNGKESIKNISLNLSLPNVLLFDSENKNDTNANNLTDDNTSTIEDIKIINSGNNAVIENINAGSKAIVEIPLKVIKQLSNDVTDKIGVKVNT